MECSTTRSVGAVAGREPKLGERSAFAKRYQPACHRPSSAAGASAADVSVVGMAARAIVAVGCGDAQARDAVANLPQAHAEPRGGRGAVEAAFVQRAHEDLALL